MKEKWLKDIHGRMADYEVAEPENLWEGIQTRMSGVSGAYRKRPFFLRPWAKGVGAVAAILLVVVGGVGMFLKKDGVTFDRFQMDPCSQKLPSVGHVGAAGSVIQPAMEAKLASGKREMCFVGRIGKAPGIRCRGEEGEALRPAEQTANECPPQTLRQEQADRPEGMQTTSLCGKRCDTKNTTVRMKEPGRFSFGVFTTGGLGTSLHGKSKGSTLVAATGADHVKWRDSPTLGILLFNQGEEAENRIHHRLPIRTGFSLAYRLNKRLEIATGLSYTLLSSDMKEGSRDHYFNGEQTLHYVGIPLNVKCRVCSWKKFDIYALGGVLLEKRVAGKVEKEYVLGGQVEKTETERVGSGTFQVSANFGAGLQYNLTSFVGVYVEPAGSYYFDDGSHVENIYKEKPFNFNLNLGVRLTFGKGR